MHNYEVTLTCSKYKTLEPSTISVAGQVSILQEKKKQSFAAKNLNSMIIGICMNLYPGHSDMFIWKVGLGFISQINPDINAW